MLPYSDIHLNEGKRVKYREVGYLELKLQRERSIFYSQVVVLVLHDDETTAIANIWQRNCKSLLAPRGNIIITWLSVC